MVGQWLKTTDGKDIYIVDYPNLLIPPRYDEDEQKRISDALKKSKEIFSNFAKDNNIELPLTEEEFYAKIAKAHLRELPNYYTLLTKMEKES